MLVVLNFTKNGVSYGLPEGVELADNAGYMGTYADLPLVESGKASLRPYEGFSVVLKRPA